MTSSERVTRSDVRVLHPIAAPKPLSELPERIWSDEDWERLQHSSAITSAGVSSR